jgi:hypothetical protein
MRIVQALHWLHDLLPADGDSILQRIRRILDDPKQGAAIRDDLRSGLDALPGWMRDVVTGLLQDADHSHTTVRTSFSGIARMRYKPAMITQRGDGRDEFRFLGVSQSSTTGPP